MYAYIICITCTESICHLIAVRAQFQAFTSNQQWVVPSWHSGWFGCRWCTFFTQHYILYEWLQRWLLGSQYLSGHQVMRRLLRFTAPQQEWRSCVWNCSANNKFIVVSAMDRHSRMFMQIDSSGCRVDSIVSPCDTDQIPNNLAPVCRV